MRADVPLFRLFGIQFTANWTWVFMFALVVWVAAETFAGLLGPGTRAWLWPLALVAALLAAISLYAHELAHALVARAFGVPVRTISLFLLGGVAHIADEAPSPRAELLIAVAGPAASLAIGLIGFGVSVAVGSVAPAIGVLGLWLALMNLPLAVFNMLPTFPLDGGRALRGILWVASQDGKWASAVATRAGQLGAAGMLLGGLYAGFTGATGPMSALWMLLIAWFLWGGATAARRSALFREALRNLTVASVMQRHIGRVDAGLTLRVFAETYVLREQPEGRQPQTYSVYRDNFLVGLVAVQDLRRVPSDRWGSTSVERIMQPLGNLPALEPGATAMQALQVLLDRDLEWVPVTAEDRLLGIVGRADLARAAARSTERRR